MIARSAIHERKKLSGRQRPKAKLFYPDKIPEVERDDHVAAGFDSDLQHHIVLGIGQKGPPEIEDLPPMPDGAQIIKDIVHIRVGEAELAGMRPRDGLVLEHEWDGHVDLKRVAAKARQELEGGPTPRSQARDQDVCVQDDLVGHLVSYTIPQCVLGEQG